MTRPRDLRDSGLVRWYCGDNGRDSYLDQILVTEITNRGPGLPQSMTNGASKQSNAWMCLHAG